MLAGLVKGILADRPARIIGNAVAASFGFLTLFQTKEKLGFIAPSAGFVQIVFGTGQSAGRATHWILSETAASTTCPVLVPLELYKNSNDSIFCDNIAAHLDIQNAYHLTLCSRRTKNPTGKKKGFEHERR